MCVCGECPARMSGDQRDSGNLKTSVFLHPDSSEDQRTVGVSLTIFVRVLLKLCSLLA